MTLSLKHIMLVTLALAWLATGASVASADEGAAIDAAALWGKNCKSCHGEDGKGTTKAGKMVGVKDFTDPAVRGSLDKAEAFKAVKEGILDEATGKKRMKAYGERLSDAEITALIDFVFALSP